MTAMESTSNEFKEQISGSVSSVLPGIEGKWTQISLQSCSYLWDAATFDRNFDPVLQLSHDTVANSIPESHENSDPNWRIELGVTKLVYLAEVCDLSHCGDGYSHLMTHVICNFNHAIELSAEEDTVSGWTLEGLPSPTYLLLHTGLMTRSTGEDIYGILMNKHHWTMLGGKLDDKGRVPELASDGFPEIDLYEHPCKVCSCYGLQGISEHAQNSSGRFSHYQHIDKQGAMPQILDSTCQPSINTLQSKPTLKELVSNLIYEFKSNCSDHPHLANSCDYFVLTFVSRTELLASKLGLLEVYGHQTNIDLIRVGLSNPFFDGKTPVQNSYPFQIRVASKVDLFHFNDLPNVLVTWPDVSACNLPCNPDRISSHRSEDMATNHFPFAEIAACSEFKIPAMEVYQRVDNFIKSLASGSAIPFTTELKYSCDLSGLPRYSSLQAILHQILSNTTINSEGIIEQNAMDAPFDINEQINEIDELTRSPTSTEDMDFHSGNPQLSQKSHSSYSIPISESVHREISGKVHSAHPIQANGSQRNSPHLASNSFSTKHTDATFGGSDSLRNESDSLASAVKELKFDALVNILPTLPKTNQFGIELANLAPWLKATFPVLSKAKGLCKDYIQNAEAIGVITVTRIGKQNYILPKSP